MNRSTGYFGLASLAVISALSISSEAQQVRRPTNDGHNLITLTFSRTWEYKLDDPAKLIDIGSITDQKKNNLVALIPGRDSQDTNRKLQVMHWDGLRFSKDASMDFKGMAIDSLLIGKFRSSRAAPVQRTPFDKPGNTGRPASGPITPQRNQPADPNPATTNGVPGKPTRSSLPPTQIVTTDGVYAWLSKGMARLFAAPLDVRLSLVLNDQEIDDRIVTGSGDNALSYEIGENYVRESSEGAPANGAGYVKCGAGNQTFPGAENMILAQDVRYVQSAWDGKYKYMVGLIKGAQAPTPGNPLASTGDRLVIYVPKLASRSKSFWQIKMEDFEEDWRSDPLPGRVMDIRVGDPKNDGKTGILILTAENKDTEGHLYFYQQDH